MAGSLNKVMIIGNLGRDPEVRAMPSGQKVANVNVATSERWTNKQTGQKEEKTEWHRIVLWGQQAEIAEKYLKKGSTAYFEGRIETRKWTDKDNQERYTTEIRCDNFTMLGGKRDGETGGDSYDQRPSGGSDFGGKSAASAVSAPKKISSDAPFDDDIPF